MERTVARDGIASLQRINDNLEDGVCITSHYSGWGTELASKVFIYDALESQALDWQGPRICSFPAFDISQTEVLQHHIEETRPQHIFKDVMERCGSITQSGLRKVLRKYQRALENIRKAELVEDFEHRLLEGDLPPLGERALLARCGFLV